MTLLTFLHNLRSDVPNFLIHYRMIRIFVSIRSAICTYAASPVDMGTCVGFSLSMSRQEKSLNIVPHTIS